ncbi:DUF7010 family protein [Flagellimonas aequoris]|uniref:DUF4386 domain-containing protein n=1 Tax=Flagellimonas aequoris TaxID=2306997 RepID=A0A418NA13_9FLAO|nr:hypothetical protein [Allomuricauda aequoris]RIV72591.1 hypothetical protein D2U88_04965 [Allomuricauda aequoris]TXK05091.1 hypothetical protein FQ019_04935 [Allomuricauda aequoris]
MKIDSKNRPYLSQTSIIESQSNMRSGYANGALGALVSGTVWLVSAVIAHQVSSQTAVWTLFFGGMLIHPLSLLVSKPLGIPGKHSKGNPLGNLAMEGTFFMLLCIPLALLLSLQNHAWFFQGMLLIIGGRYLTFSTLYGLKIYWLLGGLLGVAAFALFALKADAALSALIGSTIELGFGILLFLKFRSQKV